MSTFFIRRKQLSTIIFTFSNTFSTILKALCWVYFLLPINVGPRNNSICRFGWPWFGKSVMVRLGLAYWAAWQKGRSHLVFYKTIYRQSPIFLLLTKDLLKSIISNIRDLLALYLGGTYCHKTGTRPPCRASPRQPTIYVTERSQSWSGDDICMKLAKIAF